MDSAVSKPIGQVTGNEGLDPLALPLMAVIAFVSLVPYPFITGGGISGLPVLRLLPFAFGLGVTAAVLYRYLASGRSAATLPSLAVPVMLFVGVELLSAAGSVEPVKSLAKTVFYTVTGVAFFFAAGGLNRRSSRYLLWAVLLASLVVGLVSSAEFFMGRPPFYYRDYIQNNPYMPDPDLKGRSFSTLGHPVFLGAYFVLTVPAGIYLFHAEKRPYLRATAAICTVAALLGLFFTFSRGAYLAVLLSAFVFYRRRIGRRKAVVLLLACVAVVLGVMAVSGKARSMLERRNPYYDYVQKFQSAHRVKAFELTARVIGDAPLLGMGVGNYRYLYEKYRVKGDDTREVFATPDNMYLVTLAEVGLLGFGLFLYILYSAYTAFSAGWRGEGERGVLLMGLAMLAGFVFDIFFFDALYVEPIRLVFWTLLGISCKEAGAGRA